MLIVYLGMPNLYLYGDFSCCHLMHLKIVYIDMDFLNFSACPVLCPFFKCFLNSRSLTVRKMKVTSVHRNHIPEFF